MAEEKKPSEQAIERVTSRLLEQSDLISSEDTGIEEALGEAREQITIGQEAGAKRIESVFGREITGVREAGARRLTSFQEAQRGFGVNRAALQQIREATERSVGDLETRREEAILAGESAAAGQMSVLIIKELEFEQQARQQAFTNLLSIGGFGLQQQVGERAERQLNFVEEQAKSSIALEFGVEINEGDSITDIINRAKPNADVKRLKELDLLSAQINNMNIQAERARVEIDAADFSEDDISVLTAAALLNPSILGTIKNVNIAAKITTNIAETQITQLKISILDDIKNGVPREEAITAVLGNPNILDKIQAQKSINEFYAKFNRASAEKEQTTLKSTLEAIGGGILGAESEFLRFFTGKGLNI